MEKYRIALFDDKLEKKTCYLNKVMNETKNKNEALLFRKNEIEKYKKLAKRIYPERTPVIEYENE